MDEYELNAPKSRKFFIMCKLVGWMMLLFIVSEFLLALNQEQLITNWGIGIIGMVIFGFFYMVDEINFFLFKRNKINFFMITFFLTWLVADWDDFIHSLALTMLSSV